MNYLILLLPVVTHATFTIKITAGPHKNSSKAVVEGYEESYISDKEIKLFQLTDENIKKAYTIKTGYTPDHVWVRSPTPPNGDLYKEHKWEPVKRILKAESATIGNVTTEDSVVGTQVFVNKFSSKVKFTAGVSQSIEDTVSNTWSKAYEVSVGTQVSVSVNFGVGSASATNSLSFTGGWGEELTESESYTVGTTSGFEVELQPKQAVVAYLCATKGIMPVKAKFKATLTGATTCHYKDKPKGHYYYAYHPMAVLGHLDLPLEVFIENDMKIGFYSNVRIEVHTREE